jgi:putative glutamine amidotransferase
MRPLIGLSCSSSARPSRNAPRFYIKQSYCHALHLAGGAPVLIPSLDDEQALLSIYARLDGLLLSGGGDIAPEHFGQARLVKLSEVDLPRDRAELFLTRQAVKDGLPVFAICRGVQALNVALGGTLYQDIPAQLPMAQRHRFYPGYARNYIGHQVWVQPASQLASIVGAGHLPVNSFHHQAVKDVAPTLRVASTAPDGVIEALEGQDASFVLGVQWHPEDLVEDDPRMLRLFEAFVTAARHFSQRR